MLNQPEPTVVFSEEEQKAIDAAKSVLLNVEAEITSHNKVLKTLKAEIVKAKEEAEYVESVVDTLNQRKTELSDSLTAAMMARTEVIQETNAQADQNAQTKEELNAFEKELDSRENAVRASEETVAKDRQELRDERLALTKREEAVSAAEKAFAEASLTITWR
jgi:chromosome segregation ATPase